MLPLSLENNSTVAGTASMVHELGNMFGIPSNESSRFMPYDMSNKSFLLKQARSHFEFTRILNYHMDEMAQYVKQLSNTEKHLDTGHSETDSNQTDLDLFLKMMTMKCFQTFHY